MLPLLIGLGALSAGTTLFGAFKKSDSQKIQADLDRKQGEAALEEARAQKDLYELNSRLAYLKADDALIRGSEEVSKFRTSFRKFQGSQRASLAAQGIDISSGSAMDIQEETRTLGEIDLVTLKNNSIREAWGYKIQGLDLSKRGEFALRAGMNAYKYGKSAYQSGMAQANNTLLTGGIQALGDLGSMGVGIYKAGK